MTDHYSTLGINRDASPDDIKRAYRRLASQHHPDKGGNKETFQRVQQAYDILSDPNRRQQYDNPQPQGFHFEFGPGQGGFDFNSIFSMFGQQFGHPGHRAHHQQRPNHTRMSLWLTLEDIARGGRQPVSIGTQHGSMNIEIDIPYGINDGDHVQYAGLGPNKTDLIIQFRLHPNPKWHRNGLHLTVDHSVSIWDCIVGGTTELKDILGNTIELSIPPLTQPNSLLRLKGRGLPARQGPPGDLLVRIHARIPSQISPELAEEIRKHQKN